MRFADTFAAINHGTEAMHYNATDECYVNPRLAVTLRWCAVSDGPDVHEIDRLSFPVAWSEKGWNARTRDTHCVCTVAEASDGQVVGFMVCNLGRRAFHVDKIAVHPDFRRMGVGAALLGKLVGFIGEPIGRRKKILLAVPETNLEGQVWMRAIGFRAVETLRGVDPATEVAYLFERRAAVELQVAG